jgi:pyochelin synthetase
LERLHRAGVELWEDAGKLRYRAPRGALCEADLGELREAKAEILVRLREQSRPAQLTPDPDNRYEPFPLTDVQAAYLLGRHDAFGYAGVACHVYLEVSYPELQPEWVEEAWNRLIERHDMLRAVIDPAGFQQVLEQVPWLDIPVEDTRGLNNEVFTAALDTTREVMGHRVYETSRWPLFEIRVTQGDSRAVLHLSVDFLIADWASIWRLLAEFESLYAEPARSLPPFDMTFRDYLLAERALRESPAYGRDREYWWSRLDTLPPAPELPLGEARGENISPRFKRRFLRLDLPVWESLAQRARQHGLTPTAVVMTAYAAVIERWSRSSQFCLNLTVLNRLPLHAQVEQIVGDFTSVSLLAVDWAVEASFNEQVRVLSERLFEDLDHRLCSGIEVMREITRRRGRESALMPVVFTSAIGLMTESTEKERAQGRLDGRGITQTPQVFIDCQAMDDPQGLQVNWDVRDDVFPAGMADDMFAAFETLMRALAATNEIWEKREPVRLPDWQVAERRQVNMTTAPLSEQGLHEPVLMQAAHTPARPAVIDPEGVMTYGELASHATTVASALREAGCTAGEYVAIIMEKSALQVSAVLGVLSMGAIYVPIDTTQPTLRRRTLLEDAGISYVLTTSGISNEWPEGVNVLAVDQLTPLAPSPAVPVDVAQPAYVIFTSGSTGKPKGVVISHRAAANTVADINRCFEVGEDDRLLGLAQLGFDLSVYDIFGPLATGGSLVLPDPVRLTDPSHWATLIAEHGVTIWNSVPALMQMLDTYMETESSAGLVSLRLALLSGDWIPLELPDAVTKRLPALQVVALGGATEAAIWSSYHLYEGLRPGWRSIPYGRPLANQGFRVLDRQWRDCPVWMPGELCITGQGLALGYLGDPQITAERFVIHPQDGQRLYRTGDVGRYTPGGEIEFLGRDDTQVKIKGHRIELGEVEAILAAHPAVALAAVMVDEPRGERELLGVVEIARAQSGELTSAGFEQTTAVVEQAADKVVTGLDQCDVEVAAAHLERVVRASMLQALLKLGLFEHGSGHTLNELLECAGIPPRLHWLAKRWVALLLDTGWLISDAAGRIVCTSVPDDNAVAADWDAAEALWVERLGSPAFMSYLRQNAACATELLTGRQDPIELLFPQGQLDYLYALYRGNVMARYLNRAVSTLLQRIAEARDPQRPLRILEVGAGSGATSESVLEALYGVGIEYWFTDVAPFFLPEARAQFGHIHGMRFGLFDVDRDHREQGIPANHFNVVLAAGVLENARDVPAALTRLRELVTPGGWLVLTEPTREHAWILLSQAFMMTEPDDALRRERSYLERDEWLRLIAGQQTSPLLCLPGDGHALTPQGMHLFAQQVKTDRVPVTSESLREFLRQRLPVQMVPSHIELVDALPLTGNGKVDRRRLATWRPSFAPSEVMASDMYTVAQDALEESLCTLWGEALGMANIRRSQSFYDLGADSLIMARMAGRLREEWAEPPYQLNELPFDALLRQLVNHPSVEALASFMRARTLDRGEQAEDPAATHEGQGLCVEGSNAMLTLFGGGKGPLRVVFHAGLGTLDAFRELLAHLSAQAIGPVLGITIADTERYRALDPTETVEHLADDYTERLVATGHERVQLIGYCLGGLFATEVARRLDERGVRVEDLVLVSSHPVVFDVDDDLMIEMLFVSNLHITLEQAGFPAAFSDNWVRGLMQVIEKNQNRVPAGSLAAIGGDPTLDAVGECFRYMASQSREMRFGDYVRAVAKASGEDMPVEMALGLFMVFCHSFRSARFTPPPYAGDIRFLLPSRASGFAPGMDKTTLAFWREACLGEVVVTDIAGNHFSCIEDPNAIQVAELIAEPLREVGKPMQTES